MPPRKQKIMMLDENRAELGQLNQTCTKYVVHRWSHVSYDLDPEWTKRYKAWRLKARAFNKKLKPYVLYKLERQWYWEEQINPPVIDKRWEKDTAIANFRKQLEALLEKLKSDPEVTRIEDVWARGYRSCMVVAHRADAEMTILCDELMAERKLLGKEQSELLKELKAGVKRHLEAEKAKAVAKKQESEAKQIAKAQQLLEKKGFYVRKAWDGE
jgi:predicted secreted protein